ncbi:MAG: hypothetical protein LBD75_01525 [Candidatus Peribacteria bacterium]|jgi:phage repressor protein C with HTH and peptisase S24 domain|nr:hypothetical protein [Candidatus Peribacteria bacterium]
MIEFHKEIKEKINKNQKKCDHEHYEKQIVKNKVQLEIQELKHLVEEGTISLNTENYQEIINDNILSDEEMQDILSKLDIQKLFEKLEEIENTDYMNEIIPKQARVNKEDYLEAFTSFQKRKEVLQKFDTSLDNIHNQVIGGQNFHGNMF